MKRMDIRRRAIVCVLAVSFVLTGCGYKDMPVAPDTVVPLAISDLSFTATKDGGRLSWSYPVKTVQGDAIDSISSFELYLAEVPIKSYCGTCPIPFGKPLSVEAGAVFDGKVRKKAEYLLRSLQPNVKYFYKVKSRTSWLAASADSNIVSFVWSAPALAPTGLEVTLGDGRIDLAWQPVTGLTSGKTTDKPVVYQVLRGLGDGTLTRLGEPVSTPAFTDRQVKNGVRYRYAVRALVSEAGEMVEGLVSEAIAAVPRDMSPPAIPSGVSVVETAAGKKIFWTEVDDADLGGYRIYRRASNEDDFQLVGEVKPGILLFVDKQTNEGLRYYYTVSAIDRATPPNESMQSRPASHR